MNPSITVITPTTRDRESFNIRCANLISKQDYTGGIEHLFDFTDKSIGAKRNALCEAAKGQIILHADSDDWYRSDWVRLSVEHLMASGRDLTGISTAYFYQPHTKLLKYEYKGSQHYAIGATFCYWKEAWSKGKFQDISNGEDLYFLRDKIIAPHKHIDSFVAIIHPTNTTGHEKYRRPIYSRLPVEKAQDILGEDYILF